MEKVCPHINASTDSTPPSTQGCGECLKTGDSWVHLRQCLTCGNVGCCDSSQNTHATKHYQATKHPVMKSFEKGDNWKWCYIDEIMVQA